MADPDGSAPDAGSEVQDSGVGADGDLTVSDGSPGTATRVTSGLAVLYTFAEQTGVVVHDVSGVGAPLDLTILNPGSVVWNGDGLSINEPTIIDSSLPATKIAQACTASQALTVEAWVRPANLTQSGPARIVTVSLDLNNRDFTLAQRRGEWNFAVRATNTDADGEPSAETEGGAVSTQLQQVVWTWKDGEVSAFADGVLQGSAASGSANFSVWDAGYAFALANERTLNRPWRGEYRLVAVYCRALTAAEVAKNFAAGL